MATTRPELSTADDVLNFYALQGEERARFIVYAGHRIHPENIRFEYLADDKATGEAELSNICAAIVRNPNNTNLYILQVLADELPNPKSKKKPANSRSVTFQLNNPAAPGIVAGGLSGYDQHRLAAIERKLDAMAGHDDDHDDDDDDDDDQPAEIGATPKPADMLMAAVAGILSQPAVQQNIAAAVGGLIAKIMGNNTTQPGAAPGATVAGISGNTGGFVVTDQVAADLATIATVLPDVPGLLAKLAAMANNQPEQLKMIGGML